MVALSNFAFDTLYFFEAKEKGTKKYQPTT